MKINYKKKYQCQYNIKFIIRTRMFFNNKEFDYFHFIFMKFRLIPTIALQIHFISFYFIHFTFLQFTLQYHINKFSNNCQSICLANFQVRINYSFNFPNEQNFILLSFRVCIRLELRQVFNRDTQHVCGKTAMVNNTRGTRG